MTLLARVIRELRGKRGLQQKELAKKMGVSPQYMSDIERGKRQPKTDTLALIAVCLDLKLTDEDRLFNDYFYTKHTDLRAKYLDGIKFYSAKSSSNKKNS